MSIAVVRNNSFIIQCEILTFHIFHTVLIHQYCLVDIVVHTSGQMSLMAGPWAPHKLRLKKSLINYFVGVLMLQHKPKLVDVD